MNTAKGMAQSTHLTCTSILRAFHRQPHNSMHDTHAISLVLLVLLLSFLLPHATALGATYHLDAEAVAYVADEGQKPEPVAINPTGEPNAPAEKPTAPRLEDLPLQESVSQYGITWSFDQKVRVGQFITGDYYVVGPVTVKAIEPAPTTEPAGRNGSMLNPKPIHREAGKASSPDANGYPDRTGYDDRTLPGRYDAKLMSKPPIRMSAGDSLISTISCTDEEEKKVKHVYPSSGNSVSRLRTAAVLTCLAEPVPPDTFRPSYCGHQKKLYRYRDLHLELLPSVEPAAGMPEFEFYERVFQRPWIDHCGGFGDRLIHPFENMPDYGREIGRAVGEGTLMLMTNVPESRKKKLLIGIVQYGIDLWGVVEAGGTRLWWVGGGFGHGRKCPIVLAGILFRDEKMQKPDAWFGEDMGTMFDKCWTGANVVFAGTGGVDPKTGQCALAGTWLPYEHRHPSTWTKRFEAKAEAYRYCCSSLTWIGQALAMRMMHAEKIWDHEAFFVYCDRWMTEDPALYKDVATYGAAGPKFGVVWEKWVKNMWDKYRNNLPAAPDGHKDPPAQETWKQPRPIAWPDAPWRQAEGASP